MPENLKESRMNRIHHSCEQNKDTAFNIETHENFYCIFYSSIDTEIFGNIDVEITIDGEWEVEEVGAENFFNNQTTITFTVAVNNVTLKIISAKEIDDENLMPKITSFITISNNEPIEYCTKCGMRGEAVPIIINGEKVREGSWPWHAAIYYRPSVTTIRFRCGSTVINEKTVITIASCLVTYDARISERVAFDADKLYVSVGETVLFDSSSVTQQMFQVDEIKFHEMYKKEYTKDGIYKDDYNVALIIMKDEIQFSLHVQPICLPTSDEYDFDYRIGKVVGWGFSEYGDLQISKHLQDLTVPTYNFLTCMFKALNRTMYSGFSSQRNFCAGFRRDKGICTGDSGGGLYIEEDSKYYIYGLASYANCECIKEENRCRIHGEGFFVNVVEFLQWIQNNMS